MWGAEGWRGRPCHRPSAASRASRWSAVTERSTGQSGRETCGRAPPQVCLDGDSTQYCACTVYTCSGGCQCPSIHTVGRHSGRAAVLPRHAQGTSSRRSARPAHLGRALAGRGYSPNKRTTTGALEDIFGVRPVPTPSLVRRRVEPAAVSKIRWIPYITHASSHHLGSASARRATAVDHPPFRCQPCPPTHLHPTTQHSQRPPPHLRTTAPPHHRTHAALSGPRRRCRPSGTLAPSHPRTHAQQPGVRQVPEPAVRTT
ncbi:hypothetical protein T440DRAFT_221436 [Plenodomus tracheiphilus IPT5]|uniref:Uncharacterized protein n=1 Tax=Plenodomus tracheiphilus IPT5 TaxID=1408161 RepID=A0A6A7AUA8_9PLEO|nr:hypothetical protein T440DRAFT_221436 [Plenodomus tracheiphilus IPT5]